MTFLLSPNTHHKYSNGPKNFIRSNSLCCCLSPCQVSLEDPWTCWLPYCRSSIRVVWRLVPGNLSGIVTEILSLSISGRSCCTDFKCQRQAKTVLLLDHLLTQAEQRTGSRDLDRGGGGYRPCDWEWLVSTTFYGTCRRSPFVRWLLYGGRNSGAYSNPREPFEDMGLLDSYMLNLSTILIRISPHECLYANRKAVQQKTSPTLASARLPNPNDKPRPSSESHVLVN